MRRDGGTAYSYPTKRPSANSNNPSCFISIWNRLRNVFPLSGSGWPRFLLGTLSTYQSELFSPISCPNRSWWPLCRLWAHLAPSKAVLQLLRLWFTRYSRSYDATWLVEIYFGYCCMIALANPRTACDGLVL